jgi:murein DD-endopeptidase MepM/ murein hydrolase activator NlpD
MAVLMTIPQPAQAVAQRFVEQTIPYQLEAAGPDPELKKILPLVFSSLAMDKGTPEQNEAAEIFAPVFVDRQGAVRRSVSTQKVLPIAPEEMTGISTYFSGFHPGIDYRAKIGTPIRAVLPGVVNEVSFERGGFGRYVILVHHVDGKTMFSLYSHMRQSNVEEGDVVEAGQKVGEVGLTGRTTGPHLHFELHDTKRAMDPRKFFAGSAIAMVAK